MKRLTREWVRKAEEHWQVAYRFASRKPPLRDPACFHCELAAENYLKGLLQELGAAVPRTHEPELLLDMLLPYDAALAPFRRGLRSITRTAVHYHELGPSSSRRQTQTALRNAKRVRAEIRSRLGIAP